MTLPPLDNDDRERYAWQMETPGVGEDGQRRLKGTSVFVSRCGGVGGAIAQGLAMAGIGRLVLAHAGRLRLSDLNRQGLMSSDRLGRPRAELMAERLRQVNPTIRVEAIDSNVTETNVDTLVAKADIVACAAPLFEERLAMNDACVRAKKPLVHAAMFDSDIQVAVFHPPGTGCFRCICAEAPSWWRRRFPVFGATAAVTGGLAAQEIIKLVTGIGEPLVGRMLVGDLRGPHFNTIALPRDPQCKVCGQRVGEV